MLWTFVVLQTEKERLIIRSVALLFCVGSWAGLAVYSAWNISGMTIDLSLQTFIVYFAFMINILLREYDIQSDKPKVTNVTILLLKPQSHFELIKSFFGVPISSVCIVAGGYVWSYRSKSGKYEKSRYNSSWLVKHAAIDTGIECEQQTIEELNKIIGEDRFPYCKCVYSIRHFLNHLGGRYAIKSWFDFVPGIYAIRLIGR